MSRPRGLGLSDLDQDFSDRGTAGCALFALLAGYALGAALVVWLMWQGAGWVIALVDRLVGG